MEKTGREYLTGRIELSRNEDGSFPEEYFVRSVIGEGGSSVCYEAVRMLKDGTSETGKLKEFYPIDAVCGNRAWYYSLERLPSGQLVTGSGSAIKFAEMCKDYIDTYRLLENVMVENPENEILKSYIQYGEILYGCVNGTVYIWSRGVSGKGFDEYLSEVRKNPSVNPEKRLGDILNVIYELTDCIKALHTAGLMHMDIKPSNFLVQYDSDFEIKPNNISLFDINTLCAVNSEYVDTLGTDGYSAPEVRTGRVDNRADIYSIGAMLFNAIVISEDTEDGLYKDFYYRGISYYVKNSALFVSSDTNSDVTLMSCICRILEKCLARNPRNRYQSCTELKEDLEKAISRLTEILWSPVDRNPIGQSDPTVVMQKLMYEHPLYEAASKDVYDVNVLVIGAGTYGQKFMDICLESGQMSGVKLNITAVSASPKEDRETYLRFRPALAEFVNVDGSLKGKEESAYGTLEFHALSETTDGSDERLRFSNNTNSQSNKDIVANLLANAAAKGRKYVYVFVALGNDAVSESIARLVAEQLGYSCPVCYVSQGVKRASEIDLKNKLYPICINEPVNIASVNERFGEMAFNTHIAWEDSLNMDVAVRKNKFFYGQSDDDRYNRDSSLSFVLSIKYKLHSIGIDCKDPMEAAEQFERQILKLKDTDSEAGKKYDQMVDLEHRRWLIDMAIHGWTAPRDEEGNLKLKDCISRGSVKDKKNRQHPCMVRGSEDSTLSSAEYAENNHAKWDVGEIDPRLDELDRMSVELHRVLREAADTLRKEDIYRNSDMNTIDELIMRESDHIESQMAFVQFQIALKNILEGEPVYSRKYDDYENALRKSISGFSSDVRIKIEERLAIIRHDFFPVIESNLYRDYKANDAVLVSKIPFILTYTCIPGAIMASWDVTESGFSGIKTYNPMPIDTGDVVLPTELLTLTEKIAENVHDVWASGRIAEGWTYGKCKDPERKTSPCLLPYDELPESEKDFDRNTAMETLKLIVKLGYEIKKRAE